MPAKSPSASRLIPSAVPQPPVVFTGCVRGVGEKLVAAAATFAREHGCSGIEVTSAERRVDAHRFYQRLGFARTGLRFFQTL